MRTDGQTDRLTDVMKLIVAFRNFGNAPKNGTSRWAGTIFFTGNIVWIYLQALRVHQVVLLHIAIISVYLDNDLACTIHNERFLRFQHVLITMITWQPSTFPTNDEYALPRGTLSLNSYYVSFNQFHQLCLGSSYPYTDPSLHDIWIEFY